MLIFRRIFFGLWCLLFLLFAFWQFNDPDPLFWISIYGGAAVLSALAFSGRFPMPVLLLSIVFCLLGFAYLYPSSVSEWISQEWQQQDLSMKTQNMEEARESFGFLIVALVMSVAALYGWQAAKLKSRGNHTSTKTGSGRPTRV